MTHRTMESSGEEDRVVVSMTDTDGGVATHTEYEMLFISVDFRQLIFEVVDG